MQWPTQFRSKARTPRPSNFNGWGYCNQPADEPIIMHVQMMTVDEIKLLFPITYQKPVDSPNTIMRGHEATMMWIDEMTDDVPKAE